MCSAPSSQTRMWRRAPEHGHDGFVQPGRLVYELDGRVPVALMKE